MNQIKKIPRNIRHPRVNFVYLRTGLSIHEFAKEIERGYHPVIKTLQNLPHRRSKKMRSLIANRLGVAYDDLWGPKSGERVQELIQQEIKRVAFDQALALSQALQDRMLSSQCRNPFSVQVLQNSK